MATYIITGCSHGLGLALTAELAKTPANIVFATSRGNPTPALNEVMTTSQGRVKHVKLDITSPPSLEEAESKIAAILDGKGVDVLINNAAVINWMTDGIHAMDDLESAFSTNVNGAHLVTKTFLPLLKKGGQKKVINMSTTVGSISMASRYSMMLVPSYKITKAALNMLTVLYAQTYAEEGFTFLAVSPGWLRTELGGSSADLDVETGAKAVIEAIDKHGKESSGLFVNIRVAGWEHNEGLNQYDGGNPPW
ncbi:NAD(P)-binding Rossmann-fold containing protein [Glarea lozoyensis ATCC 20868]|uniref:NAD(P)-binding Rossmann-fold containing protein n=1 Tax=Glarea lozoyensis (strain ATCC 20868 / MF5171) TaxID=1116229 RepID=S3DCC0_GLAL2|nr:NAD(P)-binding Rossmann-fold containing protein [Glarea lozoyensis ATCC 20868]EPE34734.1 NAD(P)-binding Rossmann-fold containing protein [Glarea lozoyensis ATCC 20868]